MDYALVPSLLKQEFPKHPFIIFTDDMPDKIHIHVALYAYDSSVFSTVSDRQLRATVACSLNEDLLHIKTLADNWKVIFAAAKW